MPAKSAVLPLGSMFDVLDLLGAMDIDQYRRLWKLVADCSFTPDDHAIAASNATIGILEADLRSMLEFLRFVYLRLDDVTTNEEERKDEIARLIEKASKYGEWSSSQAIISNRLSELLTRSETHAGREKIYRLEQGFLPDFLSFNSFVDLRPNFDSEMQNIDGVIPIITINVRTSSRQHALQNITLNLPLSSVDDLEDAVRRLKSKIVKLKEKFEL